MASADESRRALAAFNRLPPPAQLTYVWAQGYYLAARPAGAAGVVRVYQVQVGIFFVKIYFPSPSDFEIPRAFHDPVYLQPYLDQIDLAGLLSHTRREVNCE